MSVNTYLAPSPVTPPFLLITALTKAYPMVMTTSTTNNYVVGQLVRLFVPSDYGMIQANGLTAPVLAVNGLNLSIDIDSTYFDTFVTPATFQPQPASAAPAGCRNIYNTQYEPFHSVGSSGN